MKKLLIVFLALILILGGHFIWKGGHHAVFLAAAMEDWLDDDSSSQSIGFEINDISLSADTFWTEYHDRRVYGVTTSGCSAYLADNTLYMDTGTAYALPTMRADWKLARKVLVGAILHGRITKDDNVYHISMETGELTLHADMTAREELDTLSLEARFPWAGKVIDLNCDLSQKPESDHTIPQPVLDAMVRTAMEPPMSITQPLEVLLPAMENLLPLQANVTLGVECGILSISETVTMTVDDAGAHLIRNGKSIPLTLPDGLENVEPVAAGLAILRSGTFTRSGENAEFRITLPAEETAGLVSQLVPQVQNLGITFTESEAVLVFTSGELSAASMSANGELPFLVTTIPLSFTAEFDIQ